MAIDVHTGSLEVAEPLHAVAAATGADPASFVLGGGDDHALLATFPAGAALPEGWTVIGAVAARRGRDRRRGGVRRATPAGRTSDDARFTIASLPDASADFSQGASRGSETSTEVTGPQSSRQAALG